MYPVLELRHISKTYPGSPGKAVDNVSFNVEKGEILALVGESGSGKTTLLRTIAGLEHPDEGSLVLSGEVISEGKRAVPAHQRNIGMVFQDYALFPHMTIAENVGFGLKEKPASEKRAIIEETLALTGLEEDLSKYPHQLSGGQQQRVALARALAPRPHILLLDEPFSNLDSILHDRVREDLRKIVKATGITTLLVTHHTRDALSMADRVAVIHKGHLLQLDTPVNIYTAPRSSYVAHLFGKYSCISCSFTSRGLETPFGLITTGFAPAASASDRLFFRPEHVKIFGGNVPVALPDDLLEGFVESSSFLGDYIRIVLHTGEAGRAARLILHSDTPYEPGTPVKFSIKPFRIVDFGNPEDE